MATQLMLAWVRSSACSRDFEAESSCPALSALKSSNCAETVRLVGLIHEHQTCDEISKYQTQSIEEWN